MRKHSGWCQENDVAHAWVTPDTDPNTHDPNAFRYNLRVCENCGERQRQQRIFHAAPPWEPVQDRPENEDYPLGKPFPYIGG